MQKLCPEAWEKYTEGLMGGEEKKKRDNVKRQVSLKLDLILLASVLICNALISFTTVGARCARLYKM